MDDQRRLGWNIARHNAFERARFLIGAAKMSYDDDRARQGCPDCR
jgi:hypothetical protein